MSDGEKAAIYYISSVLLCKESGFIVVDEPETYLNPAISNILWDNLVKERSDCKFIFITHSVDFAISRSDSKLLWLKEYKPSNLPIYEPIDESINLPMELITEILGTPNQIMVCEGEDKSSLDYSVYRILFGDEYTVIPVKYHQDVIKYCQTINDNDWISLKCKGIIDRDNMTLETKKRYESQGIIVLPFNEIEMLLMSEIMIRYILETVFPDDYPKRLDTYYENFWSTVEAKKEEIVLKILKVNIDGWIESKKIENCKTIDDIKYNLKSISEYNVQEDYDKWMKKIDLTIKEKNYSEMLIICNLKKEISRGLANRYIVPGYENVAIQHLSKNSKLKEDILVEYFGFSET